MLRLLLISLMLLSLFIVVPLIPKPRILGLPIYTRTTQVIIGAVMFEDLSVCKMLQDLGDTKLMMKSLGV